MDDPPKVQVGEPRGNLAKFLSEVEHGAEFLVMSRDRPVARLTPFQRKGGIKFGLLKGQIEIPPDFDEWPEDILASFEAAIDPGGFCSIPMPSSGQCVTTPG